MNHIIPTVFAQSKKEFHQRFEKLREVSQNLQIDFMDGALVKAKSVKINEIPYLGQYSNNFEAHLMVKNTEHWIYQAARRGFFKIIIHIEIGSAEKVNEMIEEINAYSLRAFLAINPETNLNKIKPFINKVEGILVMGVHPGKEHQSLAKNTASRIKQIKKWNKKLIVQVDGGVNDKTVGVLAKAGADFTNSGSFVSDAKDPKAALKLLENNFKKARSL